MSRVEIFRKAFQLEEERNRLQRLAGVVERIACFENIKDQTLASVRAELRDEIHKLKYPEAGRGSPKGGPA